MASFFSFFNRAPPWRRLSLHYDNPYCHEISFLDFRLGPRVA